MKTHAANLGLGDARSGRRKSAKKSAKRRTRAITKSEWAKERLETFKRNVRFAAAAKSTRTALDVTQGEVAAHYGVSTGTVCNWESGKYHWSGGDDELLEYQQTCFKLAGKSPLKLVA